MCDQPAQKQVLLRVFGGVTLVLSVIEFLVDIVVYNELSSPKLGAWWAAIVIIVTAVLGVISTSRCALLPMCLVHHS
jgi:UPF0716 family protein affecting phage T7 exclusion